MGEIQYRDKRFWYLDRDREQVLIDLRRCMDNRSRIPITETEHNSRSVMRLTVGLQTMHEELGFGSEDAFDYLLLDFLAAQCLMKTSMPFRVAELGAMNGVWSFHLASLMGQYNRDSTLCCVCDGVGNESGNRWLDRIAFVAEPPKLSMLAADYDDTMLMESSFDLVVLNGSVPVENPYRVVKEAERLVKINGVILCYVKDQPSLSDMLYRVFSDAETFEIDPVTRVLRVVYSGISWTDQATVSCRDEAEAYLERFLQPAWRAASKTELREYYDCLEHFISAAMAEGLADLKIRMIRCQETVLDAMYPAKRCDMRTGDAGRGQGD